MTKEGRGTRNHARPPCKLTNQQSGMRFRPVTQRLHSHSMSCSFTKVYYYFFCSLTEYVQNLHKTPRLVSHSCRASVVCADLPGCLAAYTRLSASIFTYWNGEDMGLTQAQHPHPHHTWRYLSECSVCLIMMPVKSIALQITLTPFFGCRVEKGGWYITVAECWAKFERTLKVKNRN